MNNISVFNFKSNNVRIEIKDNEVLFCLSDVATALGIKNANPSRFNMNSNGVHKMYSVDSLQRKNELTFINEPNLYRVIFRSNKKEAIAFQDWVFEEVLPTIRKTGEYRVTINEEQQRLIQEAVNAKVYREKTHHQTVYSELKTKFKVAKYNQLPANKFDECIAWLGGCNKSKQEVNHDMVEVMQDMETIYNYNIKAITDLLNFSCKISDKYQLKVR